MKVCDEALGVRLSETASSADSLFFARSSLVGGSVVASARIVVAKLSARGANPAGKLIFSHLSPQKVK